MFKTDRETLETLAFEFDERDIANLKSTLEKLEVLNALTISPEERNKLIEGLNFMGRQKMNQRYYVFHVCDNYTATQNNCFEGVETYFRQGNKLQELYVPRDRDLVYSIQEAVRFLKGQGIARAYTGKIPREGFLGLKRESDKEHPKIMESLQEEEIEKYASEGIEVIKLDSLI